MDLVERYLQAVKFWLPKKQQDDIIAELSEDLRAQVEEREMELGRALNETEAEELLRRRGSPIRVANGYLPQRSLIGPMLFPVYTFVLKIVTVASLVWCIAGIVGHGVQAGWPHFFTGTVRPLWTLWLSSAAITTLVFATFEHTTLAAQIFESWNPRQLPPARSANRIPRSSSVVGILGLLSLLVWWVVKMAPPLSIRLWTSRVEMAPAWSFVFWGVLALTLASCVLEVINLLRPWWTVSRAAARLVLDVAGNGVFCWFLQARLVAELFWAGSTPDKAAHATAQFNLWLAHIFPWAVAIGCMVAAFDIWRLSKVRSKALHSDCNPVRNPLS